jgi:hypothetical protein
VFYVGGAALPLIRILMRCFLEVKTTGGNDKVGADGVEILKETFQGPSAWFCLLPECFQPVAGGVEGWGQHVRSSEHSGQVFVAVCKVVGQVIAIIFEHVEGFVLDL